VRCTAKICRRYNGLKTEENKLETRQLQNVSECQLRAPPRGQFTVVSDKAGDLYERGRRGRNFPTLNVDRFRPFSFGLKRNIRAQGTEGGLACCWLHVERLPTAELFR
jgi:hypothetical protein